MNDKVEQAFSASLEAASQQGVYIFSRNPDSPFVLIAIKQGILCESIGELKLSNRHSAKRIF